MLRIYWNLAWYFKYTDFDFKVKNKFYEIFTPKLAQKLKMLRLYWNLARLIFQICQFRFKCKKTKKYLPPVKPKLVPRLKMLRIFLKFGTFDVSNIPLSTLMSKIILIKYSYQISINSEHFSFWDQSGPRNW